MIRIDAIAETSLQPMVDGLDEIYRGIDRAQQQWREASPFSCPEGCGTCCVDFEPDVLECEALYLAVWMLIRQPERAQAILDGTFISPRSDADRGCMFFDPVNPYHCTVYDGRAMICRLFAYTGDRGKDGRPRWKPCRYLPLHGDDGTALLRKQYSEEDLLREFGAVPPIMSDITAQMLALDPGTQHIRRPLREALRLVLEKITMLMRFAGPPPDNSSPEPDAPQPLAS